jgi:hypothetical protein
VTGGDSRWHAVRASTVTGAMTRGDRHAWPRPACVAEWAVGQLQSAMGRHCTVGRAHLRLFPNTKQIQSCKL